MNSVQFNQNTKSFETTVQLKTRNAILIQVKGASTSFINVEIEKEPQRDTAPPQLSFSVPPNSYTKLPAVHVTVTDASNASTFVWKDGVLILSTTSKNFDVPLAEGINNFSFKANDSFQNQTDFIYLSNVIYDIRPPIITAQVETNYIYSHYPQAVQILLSTNEIVRSLTVNGTEATWVGVNQYSYSLNVTSPGTISLVIAAVDLAGNTSNRKFSPVFGIDNIAPNIASSLSSNSYTKVNTIGITIVDNSTVTNKVYQNDILIETNTTKSFYLSLIEGINNFRIKSVDAYGNESADLVLSQITLDTVAPKITSENKQKYFFKNPKGTITYSISADEPLASLAIDGKLLQSFSSTAYNFTKNISAAGVITHSLSAVDLAGNQSQLTTSYQVAIDDAPPSLMVTGPVTNLTKNSEEVFQITVSDESNTTTQIKVNLIEVATRSEKNFSLPIELPIEGENKIEISSIDEAGNVSEVKTIALIRDSSPPVLSNVLPASNSIVDRIIFSLSASANEKVKSASVNGTDLSVGADGTTLTSTYVASSQGPLNLVWKVTDLAGNESTTNSLVNVIPQLIVPELITAIPDSSSGFTFIVGRPGSARPGIDVSATTGIFSLNRGSTVSAADGSFSIRLESFSSVKITATDTTTNESFSFEITNSAQNSLSGVIKDSDNNPLPNVTVSIEGSNALSMTDGSGVFKITSQITGDQTLIINGATVTPASSGQNKVFGKTKIAVNIGLNQNNVLERVIYLSPLYVDGTETQISNGAATLVESSHAPEITLEIPSDAVKFPDGTTTGKINIVSIDASVRFTPRTWLQKSHIACHIFKKSIIMSFQPLEVIGFLVFSIV